MIQHEAELRVTSYELLGVPKLCAGGDRVRVLLFLIFLNAVIDQVSVSDQPECCLSLGTWEALASAFQAQARARQ
jgi:hypothetical protein